MLSQLLSKLDKGGLQSTQILAKELNISQAMLKQMLLDLHRMGYIEKGADVLQNCNGTCKGCSMSGSCKSKNMPLVWTITEKGQQLVASKQ